jgi:4,5:9,10-diseco-3-hydroxy-5,9,17-trioxoandrosta-1(10),2-diene-4-oate hydrolase
MGSSLDVWDQHYPPLVASGLRVISYDRPGFGGSDETEDGSPAFQRAFLLKLLDALRLDSVGLVGHSQAGGFVIQLALDHPQRVSRVMVLGTGSMLPPLEGVPPNPPDPTGEASRDIVRQILEEQLYHQELITPEVIESRYPRALGHAPRAPAAPGGGAAATPATPLWQRLGELTMPLMLIYGADDRGSVAERAQILAERYPKAAVWVVPHAKHLLQWDAPEEFIAAAKDFFGQP